MSMLGVLAIFFIGLFTGVVLLAVVSTRSFDEG